jgi:hypothetical protein
MKIEFYKKPNGKVKLLLSYQERKGIVDLLLHHLEICENMIKRTVNQNIEICFHWREQQVRTSEILKNKNIEMTSLTPNTPTMAILRQDQILFIINTIIIPHSKAMQAGVKMDFIISEQAILEINEIYSSLHQYFLSMNL